MESSMKSKRGLLTHIKVNEALDAVILEQYNKIN